MDFAATATGCGSPTAPGTPGVDAGPARGGWPLSAGSASRAIATGPVHTITFIGATADEYFDM